MVTVKQLGFYSNTLHPYHDFECINDEVLTSKVSKTQVTQFKLTKCVGGPNFAIVGL